MHLAALFVAGALTLAPAPERPDKIVYTSIYAPDPKNAWVYIMDGDGSNRTPLSKEGSIEIDPTLSPDGQRITFVAVSKDDMKGDVWVMAADGSGRKQLTHNVAKTIAVAPAWSPNGKHILFTRMTAANGPPTDAELFVIDADGRNEKSLRKGMTAVWSPDGKRILYTGPNGVLWVMDADGENAQQLFKASSRMGAYSPDGKRIAYVGAPQSKGPGSQFAGAGFGGAGREAPTRIYVANADGSGAAPVTTAEPEASESAPRWSPDGKRIYFNRMPEKDGAGRPANLAFIIAIDPDGKNEKELVRTEALELLGGAAGWLRLP